MDKIIDKFYNGSIQNNGYNKSRLTNNKFSSPNLLENRYNRTNNYNQRYNNGQRIMANSPIPRTQYSMGLQAPTITGRPPSHYTTIPYETINPYSTLQKNYPNNILKMNILDTKIKQLEEENKRDRLRIQRLMEGSTFSPDQNNNFNRTSSNYINNPNSLDQAMDNLRNPYLSSEEIAQKQALRREQVQFELEKARQKVHEDRINNERILQNLQMNKKEKNYTISNYSDESGEDSDEESSSYESFSKSNNKNSDNKHLYRKFKKREREKDRQRQQEMNNIEDKVLEVLKQNHYNNEEINNLRLKNEEMLNALKSKEEAEDFINNIPDHVALQLQNDNFKMRSNINSIKEGFREIKNDLDNKLELLQMKQNMNFEVIRKIIEQGGNKKINAGLRKYMDGEEIDLNNIHEDFPEYLKNIPALIDKKIRENEEKKREEQNRLLNEEINKKYDMMEYKYGYANSFYSYKNKYKSTNNNINNNNPNNNKNFVISKNYGRFQYIPSKDKKKTYNSFRQNAEQNLKMIKEKEKQIPGVYAYGVGNKNMDSYVPIKMNGCFDDWYNSKKNADKKDGEEYQILDSASGSDVGINAIKKRVNSKSIKSESKTEKTKKSKKSKKTEKSQKKSEKTSKTKSSKAKSSKSSKKDKKDNNNKKNKKNKKSGSDKDSEEDENKDSNEEKEDEDKNSGSEKDSDENEKGSDEKGSDEKGSDEKGSDEKGSDEKGSDEKGSDEKGSDEKDSDEKGSDEKDSDEKDSDEKDSDEKGSDEKDSDEKDSDEKDSDEKDSDEKDSDEKNSDEDSDDS